MTQLTKLAALSVLLVIGCSDAQPSTCESAADCNDGDDCTTDTCNPASKTCSNSPLVDGTRCDFDGLPGVCMSGVCGQGLCAGVDCNDDNACTDDACDFSDGTCSNRPVSDGTFCDFDGVTGVCAAGECIEDRCVGDRCNDGNDCTNDFCDPRDGSCTNTPAEDGVYCDFAAGTGGNDGTPAYCLEGVCVQDFCFDRPCDDDNPCTFDHCSPEDGSCTNPNRTDGTPCMDDLGMCVEGACVVLPVCGDGRAIPGTAPADDGRLRCEVQLLGLSTGVELKMAATPLAEVQQGDNDFELQVEFGIDAETVEDALQRGLSVIRIHSILASIDATMGDSDPTPMAVEQAPVPCTVTFEHETPAAFVSPRVEATWTLDMGQTLELTLQQFEEVLFIFGGMEIVLSTLGPSANCVWETEPPAVLFTVVPR